MMPWLLNPDWGVLIYLAIFSNLEGPLGLLFILIHYNENLAFAFTKGRKSALKLVHSIIFSFLLVVSLVSAVLEGSTGLAFRILYVAFPFAAFTAASSFPLQFLTMVTKGGWPTKLSRKAASFSPASAASASSAASSSFSSNSSSFVSYYPSLYASSMSSPSCFPPTLIPWQKLKKELRALHRHRCMPSVYLLSTVMISWISLACFAFYVPLENEK